MEVFWLIPIVSVVVLVIVWLYNESHADNPSTNYPPSTPSRSTPSSEPGPYDYRDHHSGKSGFGIGNDHDDNAPLGM